MQRKLKADKNHNANESLAEEGSEAENPLLDILTIFVSNIDPNVTQLDLAAHFQIVGDIKKLTLGKDPETGFRNGEAFIQFKNEASVENALTLDESTLGGSVLKVTRKVSYSPSFAADSNGNNRGESHDYDLDSIYIANIPDTTTDLDIIDHFKDVGAITRMTRLRDKRTGFPKPCGYIQFLDPNSVESALKYNGSFLRGNQIHIAKKRKKDT